MKTLSYILGRVVSSELNRSIARSEAQQRKINEIKYNCAKGQKANQALAEWAKTHPDDPILQRYVDEATRINNDLRLTNATRIEKTATVAENAWRLVQQESQAEKALAEAEAKKIRDSEKEQEKLNREFVKARIAEAKMKGLPVPKELKGKHSVLIGVCKGLIVLSLSVVVISEAIVHSAKQAQPAPKAEITPTPSATPVATPTPSPTTTDNFSPNGFDDYDFPDPAVKKAAPKLRHKHN